MHRYYIIIRSYSGYVRNQILAYAMLLYRDRNVLSALASTTAKKIVPTISLCQQLITSAATFFFREKPENCIVLTFEN